jgi:hypothetical protein
VYQGGGDAPLRDEEHWPGAKPLRGEARNPDRVDVARVEFRRGDGFEAEVLGGLARAV